MAKTDLNTYRTPLYIQVQFSCTTESAPGSWIPFL